MTGRVYEEVAVAAGSAYCRTNTLLAEGHYSTEATARAPSQKIGALVALEANPS